MPPVKEHTTPCDAGQPPANITNRRDEKFERRIAQLQVRFKTKLRPPALAAAWPKAVLMRWYQEGGDFTIASATVADNLQEEKVPSLVQYVGVGLPARSLEPTVQASGGLLGAAARGESNVFEQIGEQLQTRGFALAELGAPTDDFWPCVCNEGRMLWSRMKPGILTSSDGVSTSGKDPSGAARGDRFITSSEARAYDADALPALGALDAALASIGTVLNDAALMNTLVMRSDPFFACFPGGGARYGAHFDGGGVESGCRLTTIVYANPDWRTEDGGELHLYDEPSRCWRSVLPLAGHVIFFRADEILHKVEPTMRERFALTSWWFTSPRSERVSPNVMPIVKAWFEVGDPRRRGVFKRDAHGRTERELLVRMRNIAGIKQ